jgi:hypothetical protein
VQGASKADKKFLEHKAQAKGLFCSPSHLVYNEAFHSSSISSFSPKEMAMELLQELRKVKINEVRAVIPKSCYEQSKVKALTWYAFDGLL